MSIEIDKKTVYLLEFDEAFRMEDFMSRECKKIMLFVLILVTALCLVACGKSAVPSSNESTVQNSQSESFENELGIPEETRTSKGAQAMIAKTNDSESNHSVNIENQTATPQKNNILLVKNSSSNTKNTTSKKQQVKGMAFPSTSGALHVEGTQLVDSKGNAVQLKGISTHGLAWFPKYVNEDSFRQLRKEWNVNVIRLAMYTAEYGGYNTGGNKEALKNLIRKGVKYATNQDMYVIIDWHILSDHNPNTYKKEAKKFFAQMSKEFANHNNVIYEICNEPNGSTSWRQIKSYAEEIIPVIRSNDSDAIIIVGTPNWSQKVDQAAKNPITTSKNIMYALHFYAATHKESLRNTMVSAIQAGLPVFVSEYGISDASGNGAIDKKQANQWVKTMNQYGVSYVAWNLSNKNEASSIIKSSSNKTSGFTKSDLSESGKWLYSMLTGNSTFLPSNTPSKTDGNNDKNSQAGEATKPTNGNQGSTSAPTNQNSGTKVSLTDKQIQYTVELINSWESGGSKFYHYNLTLKNNSSKNGSSWTITVPFNEKVTLNDGWNGVYTTKNNSLTISSKDYNGTMVAGGSVGNVGFIVSGSSNLKIKQ